MILYDEFGELLGVDEESMKLFRCQDIDEFKIKVRDVAEYFVKAKGYIYKFKNYSWLDFLNYSGENINKVLIKQDSNSAIEAKIVIRELVNVVKINNSNVTYMVDFIDKKQVYLKELFKIEENAQNVEDKKEFYKFNKEKEKEEYIEIKWDQILNEYDIDKEFYLELIDDFIDESENSLKNIELYISKRDYDLILKSILKLKNIAINLKLQNFDNIFINLKKEINKRNDQRIKDLLNDYYCKLNLLKK